ncbi:hypothetical protein K1719_038532 [Acacia pycnantha]|nr:hypothetical protein K1719_038532 [Acacia pycnantha]
MAIHSVLVLVFGFLGDVASILSFLEPVPKFYRVYKKKRTEGLESMPYIASLFSAMLWLFYAYVKTGEMFLVVVNASGCVVETIYLAIYITYCPKKARMPTLRLILLLNFGVFCVIVLLTHLLAKGAAARVKLLGWICVVFATSAADVVAPAVSIVKKVIRKKSVERLSHPIMLLVKVIAAITWLLYGLALKDFYVTLPNAVRISFGIVQMVLYAMYRKKKLVKDEKLQEHKGEVTNENKGEVLNENKNVRHDPEKHETVSIEMGDQKKKLDEEEEKPREAEEKDQEQPPQNRQDQQTKVSEIQPQNMVADDQTRLKGKIVVEVDGAFGLQVLEPK